jgi:hypothetical protein
MIVREHINFERGLDPKEAMGIGLNVLSYEDWKKRFWDKDYYLRDETYRQFDIRKYGRKKNVLTKLNSKIDSEIAEWKYNFIIQYPVDRKAEVILMNKWLKRNGWLFQYDE